MKAVLLGMSLFLAFDGALACKCSQYSLPERQSHADVVFVGSTQSTALRPGKQGETITFKVSRGIKGVQTGESIIVDPSFESDCTAPLQPGIKLLVFAYKSDATKLTTNACSIRAAEAISIDGHVAQPSPETLKFLKNGT